MKVHRFLKLVLTTSSSLLILLSFLTSRTITAQVTSPTPTPTYELIFYLTPPPPTPTPTRIPDTTPPKTTISIFGESTVQEWYRSVVTIIFSGIDDRVGVGRVVYRINPSMEFTKVLEYRGHPGQLLPITITQEGIYPLEYYAIDQLGNVESPHTTTLKIDLTPPTITLPIDLPSGYTRCDAIPYIVNDSLGTTIITATLDSQSITQTVELFKVELGTHTLTITVTDEAGWVTNLTQNFTLTANIPSLICTKHKLFDLGEIYGNGANGIVNSLDAKLEAAQKSIDKGNTKTATNQLNAFINEVEAQRDKKITPLGADLMIGDAQEVIELLERGEYQAMQIKRSLVYLPVLIKQ